MSDSSPAGNVRETLPKAALLALAVGQFLVGLDLSVMSVALPSIQREFNEGMLQLQWAVMAYMVAGAALAVPFGALGDRIGRRRVYLFGTTTFVIGSAVSALAPGMIALIRGDRGVADRGDWGCARGGGVLHVTWAPRSSAPCCSEVAGQYREFCYA